MTKRVRTSGGASWLAATLSVSAVIVSFVVPLAAQQPGPLAPLTNSIVNAPDTTEHDTQATTAIILGTGSTVITAFGSTSVDDGGNHHRTGWARSTNTGSTWADGGALPSTTSGDGGMPTLARDQTSGRIYLSTNSYTGAGSVAYVFRSDDDGASWGAAVNTMPGFSGGDVLFHPSVAVDNFAGTGQGNVYVVAQNFAGGGGGSQTSGVYFSKSTDGGSTFSTPVRPQSNGGAGPTVVVGPDHAVYIFWLFNSTPRLIRFVKSTDFGATFTSIATVVTLQGTGVNGDLGLGGGFSTDSYPRVFVSPPSGLIAVVYNDKNGADKADIMAVASDDGGTTWDTPDPINGDVDYGSLKDQFSPAVAVTSDGHALVTWYDRRSDAANSQIERWGRIFNLGSAFSATPEFRISTASWPVVVGQDSLVPAAFMGFYDGVAAGNNYFYVAWSDNRLPNPANTPLPHANQPDIRFAKIPVTGPAEFDLDRDFQTDRTIFRPSAGTWFSAFSNGGATATGWGTAGDVDVMADYDGDGKADLGVFRPSSGTWFLRRSSDGTTFVNSWGGNGDIPVPLKNADPYTDLAVFRPSSGTWFVKHWSGLDTVTYGWGTSTDVPLVADIDGDGAGDLIAYRNGVWYVLANLATTPTPSAVVWGTTGDIPVVGDFDADGKDDPTVFRPSTGTWFVKLSTGGTFVAAWGAAGDIPVSGDFDGDRKADLTVFRPSTGVWFTQFSSGGTTAVGWGTTGDKPVGRVPGS